MAWGFIGELPITREQYDRIDQEIGEDPEGLILHTSSETGGRMRIIDVWESEEAYRRFEQETLFPVFQRVGIDTSGGPPPIDSFEVHKLRGRAS